MLTPPWPRGRGHARLAGLACPSIAHGTRLEHGSSSLYRVRVSAYSTSVAVSINQRLVRPSKVQETCPAGAVLLRALSVLATGCCHQGLHEVISSWLLRRLGFSKESTFSFAFGAFGCCATSRTAAEDTAPWTCRRCWRRTGGRRRS